MVILHVTIKRVYFDLIKAGKKKYEYRLKTNYWKRRFKKQYTTICFRAGYAADSPTLFVEFKGIKTRRIKHEFFGRRPVNVFEIALGKILNKKQYVALQQKEKKGESN